MSKLFSYIKDKLFHWRIMVTLALAARLRRGELLGLEWSHIDLEKGTIKVEQTIVRGKAGKPVLKHPKRNQTRIVSIS